MPTLFCFTFLFHSFKRGHFSPVPGLRNVAVCFYKFICLFIHRQTFSKKRFLIRHRFRFHPQKTTQTSEWIQDVDWNSIYRHWSQTEHKVNLSFRLQSTSLICSTLLSSTNTSKSSILSIIHSSGSTFQRICYSCCFIYLFIHLTCKDNRSCIISEIR